jgi:hypothetical protein
MGANRSVRGENTATNHLSYSMAEKIHKIYVYDNMNSSHLTLLISSDSRYLHGLKILWRAMVAVGYRQYRCLYIIQSSIDVSELHIYEL